MLLLKERSKTKSMASARAIEPVEVAAQRKQQNRKHMANARAIEPVEVATQKSSKTESIWLMQEPLSL